MNPRIAAHLCLALASACACGGTEPAAIDAAADTAGGEAAADAPPAEAAGDGPGDDAGADGTLGDTDDGASDAPEPHDASDGPDADDDAGLPPLRDDALLPEWTWEEKARRAVDRWTLPPAYAAAGTLPPAGTEAYAARVVVGVEGPAYVLYESGGGAFVQDFWPASTVKLLAAIGALEFARTLGFTGDAVVAFETGFSDRLRNICDRALVVSSNVDYDRTMQIAGFDRINTEVLTAARGFPTTVLQRSYTGDGVRISPAMTLSEGSRSRSVAERTGTGDYGCGDRDGNCADLFELTEAVRRIVLDAEIPPVERFDLDPADVAALAGMLCRPETSFFLDGVVAALGGEPRICHKTGSVWSDDYLDHGLVEDPRTGRRVLLAAAVPDQGGDDPSRAALAALAERILRTLAPRDDGLPLQRDAGIPIVVQLDDLGSADGRRRCGITVEAFGADRVDLFTDGWRLGEVAGIGPRFAFEYAYSAGGERLFSVRASRGGVPVGFRALRVRIEPP
jgi:hypothetical protein